MMDVAGSAKRHLRAPYVLTAELEIGAYLYAYCGCSCARLPFAHYEDYHINDAKYAADEMKN